MKIPTKEQVRKALTDEFPEFKMQPQPDQDLQIITYRLGYTQACIAASNIAADHMDKLADRTKRRLDMKDIACKPVIDNI